MQRIITRKVLDIFYTNKTITEDYFMCDNFSGPARVSNEGKYLWALCNFAVAVHGICVSRQ